MRVGRDQSVNLHWIAAGALLALVVACGRAPEPTPTPGEPEARREASAPAPAPGIEPQAGSRRTTVPPPRSQEEILSVEKRLREVERIPFTEGSDGAHAAARLQPYLVDPELDVREAAVMALAEVEGDAANQALAGHLRVEKDGMLKIDIIDELIDREAPQALDSLLYLLGDPDSEVRERSADGLDELGDPRAVPALHDALRAESDEFVRDALVFALSSLDPDFDEEEYEIEED